MYGKVLKDDIVKEISWLKKHDECDQSVRELTTFQLAADSSELSKNTGLELLSTYLNREVALGHVIRQELTSMVPALMLNIEPWMNVLDVCAAPGSKTEQMLSMMRCPFKQSSTASVRYVEGMGMLVANDADSGRIQILKKRYARCGSPNLVLTCCRAEDLQQELCGDNHTRLFDRILADVPCSGDGTIRKFPHIWRLFRPRMALELHKIQLQIAKSSLQMLRVGGRMVYSTCCKCLALTALLPFCLFVCLSDCVCLSVCLSVYLSICVSVCLSVCLCVCLSVHLSIYPSIY